MDDKNEIILDNVIKNKIILDKLLPNLKPAETKNEFVTYIKKKYRRELNSFHYVESLDELTRHDVIRYYNETTKRLTMKLIINDIIYSKFTNISKISETMPSDSDKIVLMASLVNGANFSSQLGNLDFISCAVISSLFDLRKSIIRSRISFSPKRFSIN